MNRNSVLLALAIASAGSNAWAADAASLDRGLIAMFDMSKTEVYFSVCGQTGGTSGCYGGAYLNPPFDYACGVLQGKPKTHGDIMTRTIYVLDKRTATTDDMLLYVYERKDVIQNSSDQVSASLKTTIDLGITGGASAHCIMAGNDDYVYAGADASTIVSIQKHANKVANIPGQRLAGDTPVSIIADDRGYVSMNYTYDFYLVDPHGKGVVEGGGNYALISQRNGWMQN